MRDLLETNVVSDFVRGHDGVAERLRATPPAEVAISTVTEMELEHGLALAPARTRRLGLTLVKANLEELSRVDGLVVESWR